MTDPARDDLEDRIDELEETLDALREELAPERGPMGLPRPPRPREFLRFTDEYAIPAAVAAMRANIRALELLQAGIRVTDRDRAAGEAERAGRAVRDRATEAGSATLDRLDRALADLESAMEGRGTPANPEARDLLSEARRLNDEIRDRVAVEAGGRESEAVRIDVESELETIREEVGGGDADSGDEEPAVSE